MTLQEMINVIQAYKDGKQIESKIKAYDLWVPVDIPSWNFAVQDYRIKPKQTKELYKYLLYSNTKDPYYESPRFYESLDDITKDCRGLSVTIIKRLDDTKITIVE